MTPPNLQDKQKNPYKDIYDIVEGIEKEKRLCTCGWAATGAYEECAVHEYCPLGQEIRKRISNSKVFPRYER